MKRKEKWYLAINGYGFCVTDGWQCDYPLKYEHNGQIVYDSPERLPKYIKERVRKYYDKGCPESMVIRY